MKAHPPTPMSALMPMPTSIQLHHADEEETADPRSGLSRALTGDSGLLRARTLFEPSSVPSSKERPSAAPSSAVSPAEASPSSPDPLAETSVPDTVEEPDAPERAEAVEEAGAPEDAGAGFAPPA